MGEQLQLERRGTIAIVTMNRPGRKNAFSDEMWTGLEGIAVSLEKALPRCVVITGVPGGVFCAGMDVNPDNAQIAKIQDAVGRQDLPAIRTVLLRIRELVDRITGLPVPVVAAINGDAYGGGAELAVRCDLRIMDPKAALRFSEVTLGLIPDWGGGVALTRLVGPGIASDLILTARPLPAAEALFLGVANRISEEGRCLENALALAGEIAANGPRSVRAALRVIRTSPDIPLQDALDLETDVATELIGSGECYHGILAFLEKRPPQFPDPE